MKPADSFLHVADLHFWSLLPNPLWLLNKRAVGQANVWLRRRHEYRQHLAAELAETLAEVTPRAAILTGDFTSTALPSEFEAARGWIQSLQDAGINPWVIPGNHDVYTFESIRHRRFEAYLGDWMPAPALPAAAELPNGTPVVFAPTVCPNWISSRGRIEAEGIDATLRLVQDTDGPVVLAAHYPVLEETPAYRVNENRSLRGAEDFRHALGETGRPILYLAGHVHRFHFGRDPEYSNLVHLTTGTLFGTDHVPDKDAEFSVVELDAASVRVERRTRHSGTWKSETSKIEF